MQQYKLYSIMKTKADGTAIVGNAKEIFHFAFDSFFLLHSKSKVETER